MRKEMPVYFSGNMLVLQALHSQGDHQGFIGKWSFPFPTSDWKAGAYTRSNSTEYVFSADGTAVQTDTYFNKEEGEEAAVTTKVFEGSYVLKSPTEIHVTVVNETPFLKTTLLTTLFIINNDTLAAVNSVYKRVN